MDELIQTFIKTYLPQEMVDLIYESYELFEKYDYEDVEYSLIDILSREDYISSDELQDVFITEFNNKLDFVIRQNGIELHNNVSIHDKNEILKSLYLLQHLEDYSVLSNIVNTHEDDHFKISSVIAENCSLDVSYVMGLLSEVEYTLVTRLKQYIDSKMSKDIQEHCNDDVIKTIKIFFSYLSQKNKTCLGTALVQSRAQLGVNFNYYFPLVSDDIISLEDEQTALNILSIIMLSSDGQVSVLETFRNYIGQLLESITHIQKVESSFTKHYNSYLEYRQKYETLNNEKTGLLKTSS